MKVKVWKIQGNDLVDYTAHFDAKTTATAPYAAQWIKDKNGRAHGYEPDHGEYPAALRVWESRVEQILSRHGDPAEQVLLEQAYREHFIL